MDAYESLPCERMQAYPIGENVHICVWEIDGCSKQPDSGRFMVI